MTTPDTSAVRAWAKKNGYDVAGRGRLPAEVSEAYLAAQGGSTRTSAKKAPAKKATAKKAPAKKSARTTVAAKGTAVSTAVRKAEPTEVTAAAPAAAPASEQPSGRSPQPKPSVVTDDRRLVALGEEIKALTARVEALEKATGTTSGNAGKNSGAKSRFRRRS